MNTSGFISTNSRWKSPGLSRRSARRQPSSPAYVSRTGTRNSSLRRLRDRERADPAGVVLGLEPGLAVASRMARHPQQVGAPAQLADVAQEDLGVRLAAVGIECTALAVERVDEHGELHHVEHRPVA